MKKDCVLVINCGSSSLKFSLINPLNGDAILDGLAERLLSPEATIKINFNGNSDKLTLPAPFGHQVAIAELVLFLTKNNLVEKIYAVGHRVVHGGELYSAPTLINDEVKQAITDLSKLAPLHNPANLIGIEATQQAFADLPQVAIFDTAFHQTMPEKAFIYGVPYQLYKEHGVRRYGFHGTSHYFVGKQAAKILNKPFNECNFISAHLGNGCSVTAIKNGKSVDTSMGFTPLEGVMMGTRSGSLDAGIIFHLIEQLNYTPEQVNSLLNKESGLLGVSEISNDCRTLEQAMNSTDSNQENAKKAKLALSVFCYQIAKSIASFSASLQQLDGLIFTGGIGENSLFIREQILSHLSLLNFTVDDNLNETTRFGKSGVITKTHSRPCWVIPTNEEWVIAEQSYQLLTAET